MAKSSGGGSGVRGTYSLAGQVVKRGAGGRFMGSVKYRTNDKYSRSTGGVDFKEARATYNQATHFARQATDASLKESLKFHRQFSPHVNSGKRVGPRAEYSQMVAGAAYQRELRRRGYGVHDTRAGLQIHSPGSGVNTGAKAAARGVVQHEKPKKVKQVEGLSNRPGSTGVRGPLLPGSRGTFGRGKLAQAGYSFKQARVEARSARDYYRGESSSFLGGELTRRTAQAKSPKSPPSQVAYATIQQRAVAREINRQRQEKAGSVRPSGSQTVRV